MAKRIITLILAVIFAMSLVTGIYAATSQDDAQRLLGVLGIMNGDGNGNLNLDKNVTRAEFSKMLVVASSYKDSVLQTTATTGFSDVPASHWAAPYIQIASNNNWIYGYSDGRFAPSNNIKLEEAATMLLRALGYTSADVKGVYPVGQLALYESLELDEGVSAKRGEIVSRRDCLYLFVNLLNAKTKSGHIYAQTLGITLGVDGKVDIYKTVSEEMEGPYVIKSGISDLPVNISGYTVYKDDTTVTSAQVEKYDVAYYSEALRTVWIYNDTVTGTYDNAVLSGSIPTSVTVGGKNYTFEESDAAKSMSVYGEFAKEDSVTLLLGKDGGIVKVLDAGEYNNTDTDEYLNIVNNTLDGPYVYMGEKLPFMTDGVKYIKESAEISGTSLEAYDVLYYSKIANTVWVYRKAVTGKYDAATPSISAPTNVIVSGKTYSIETSEAANELSFMGKYELEDAITLLLGKDGGVAAVVDATVYRNTDTDEYLNIVNNTLDGPYVYMGEKLSFMTDGVKYVKESAEIPSTSLEAYDVLYYSKIANTVWVYRDAVTGKYSAASPSVSAPSVVTVGAKAYSIETSKAAYELSFMGRFELEDMLTLLLGKDGGVVAAYSIDEHIHIDEDNYLELVESTLKGPYVVTSKYEALGLPTSGLSVKKNDAPSSLSNIKPYDVVYYSEVAKTLLVYSKTVSGTYMSALPNTDTPAQITVAGGTYTLANAEVALTVSALGQYRPGDLITLLLGRNDEVAGVVSMSVFANNVYGVVTGVASENYTDTFGKTYSAKTVTMLTTDGDTLKLEGVLNTLSAGDVIKVTYSDGMQVERVKARSVTGTVTGHSIGDKKVASDVNILETNLQGKNPTPIFFSRLTGATLKEDDVRYYAINSEGEITDIILSDFSGDSYTYGIITTAQSTSGFVSEDEDYDYSQITTDNFLYEYQVGSTAYSMTVPRPYTYATGPCVFKYNGQSLEEITALKKLKSVDTYTSFGIVSAGELYLFSDYLTVYTPNTNKQSALDYSVMSISELTNDIDSYNVYAYYDTTPKNGGRIRIIIAILK